MTAGRPPGPFQGQRERMFMITGIGVHDQPDYAFKITGIRTLPWQVIEPAPTTCLCCGGARLRKLSEDVTETLEVVPRSWKVIQHVREKFTCRDCEKISQAPAPFHVVPRGWAGPGLLAMILFEKFGHPSRASSTMAASAPRTMRRNERCAVSPSAVSHGSSPGPTEVAGEPPSCTA